MPRTSARSTATRRVAPAKAPEGASARSQSTAGATKKLERVVTVTLADEHNLVLCDGHLHRQVVKKGDFAQGQTLHYTIYTCNCK